MRTRILGSVTLAIVLGVGLLGGSGRIAVAQTPRTIDFVVPTGTQVAATGPTDPGDIVIFSHSEFLTDCTGCAAQSGMCPVQDAVVIDPGTGTRGNRVFNVIVTADSGAASPVPPPPIKPGTKISSLIALPQCQNTATGILYDAYRGTVQ